MVVTKVGKIVQWMTGKTGQKLDVGMSEMKVGGKMKGLEQK